MLTATSTGGKSELTARERQVLIHLAKGESYLEIADELSISIKTVEKHVASARLKLAAPSRTAAVATAIRLHLIEQDAFPLL